MGKEWASEFFSEPLLDLGIQHEAFAGVLTPAPELQAARLGITSQFLENGAEYHRKYSASAHFEALLTRAFAAMGGTPKAESVLDIGTGSGVNTIVPLLRLLPECRIVATDLSPNLLRMLHDYVAEHRHEHQVIPVCADAMQDYFRPAAFDLVVGAAILHHLMDPTAALKASHRALRPGGAAIFFEPFEAGMGVLTFAYSVILSRATQWDHDRYPGLQMLKALVFDTQTRAGRDKAAPHFEHMDDKWLFTRQYLNDASRAAGFSSLQIVPHAAHGSLYRDFVTVQLRLYRDLTQDALPGWAWDVLRLADESFSDDAKADTPPEATIILTKA